MALLSFGWHCRHCEERSDDAIFTGNYVGLLRFARNDAREQPNENKIFAIKAMAC
jgi:hypothetical protein